ncbi:hypothetical protein PENSPDRAFT_418609 [Peniophora sp. CONT]|nr:hypothetical protein PENSPDRAFT_418609 [Peniophora sp. CONT]
MDISVNASNTSSSNHLFPEACSTTIHRLKVLPTMPSWCVGLQHTCQNIADNTLTSFHTEDLSIEKNDAQFDSAAAAPLVQAEGRVNGGPQPTGNALVQKALVLYGSLTSASTEETALDVCDEFEVDEVEGSDVVALTEEEVQQAKDSLPEGVRTYS